MKDESRIDRDSADRHESGKSKKTQILVLDVSSTGALLECDQYIKPGGKAVVQLPLGEDIHEARGIVVHCEVHEIQHISGKPDRTIYRVGVKFDELEPACKTTIQELIKERLYLERREQPRLFLGRQSWLEKSE